MEHLNEFFTVNWVMILMWFFLLGMIINSFLKSSHDISPQQTVQLMSHEAGSVILDIREDKEYQSGHIKDSIHIPLSSLSSRINELKKYKEKNIILGCRSGSRSSRACGMLKKNGFEKIHNLRGGVVAWEKDNLPMSHGN
ncbi:MAG: rhodanese-like domain-containing protein [Gammaproteobacteria bacterium]|nr:rhodanese-like domain-containing protein [Gammaproteobacteria bacterium]